MQRCAAPFWGAEAVKRILMILPLILAGGTATAADLWCMPDSICRGERCVVPQSEEESVRLTDADGARPVLRSDGEDVPMRAVRDGATVEWRGHNGAGATETLAWVRADGSFVYQRRLDDVGYKATGRCEVQ